MGFRILVQEYLQSIVSFDFFVALKPFSPFLTKYYILSMSNLNPPMTQVNATINSDGATKNHSIPAATSNTGSSIICDIVNPNNGVTYTSHQTLVNANIIPVGTQAIIKPYMKTVKLCFVLQSIYENPRKEKSYP